MRTPDQGDAGRIPSQTAEELIRRHIHFVRAVALRRVGGDEHLADDVTQAVFILLLRKAHRISSEAGMTSWLYTTTRYAAANAVKMLRRRKFHEQRFAAPADTNSSQSDAVETAELGLLVHQAIDKLPRTDRLCLVMNFLQEKTHAQVGTALGMSAEAARKRTGRALERVRELLAVRGAVVPVTAVGASLAVGKSLVSAQLIQSTLNIAILSQPAQASAAASIAKAVTQMRLACKLKVAGALAAALLLTGGAVTIAALFIPFQILASRPQPPQAGAVVAVTQPVAPGEPATRPTTLTLNQVIAGIRKTETQFQNVHIKDFLTTVEKQPHGQTAWISTPMKYAGSAWCGPDPRGPRRIYLTDMVLPWEQGAAPWAEHLIDAAWDGHEGIELNLAGGSPGTLHRDRTAMLSSHVSPNIGPYAPDWSGTGYTLQYRVEHEDLVTPVKPRTSLADKVDLLSKVKPELLEIADQSMDGFNTVRVRMHSGSPMATAQAGFFGSDTYWFDPSRGYALVRWQFIMKLPNYSRTEGFDVFEFKQVGVGLWFPIRGQLVREAPPDGYERWTYQASNVIVNDLRFDASIFRPKIPIGWLVADDRTQTRRSYVTMEDGSELELHKGSVMPQMEAGVATRPDGDTPAILSDPRAWW